jgi:LPS sulfotransferase NodH
MHRALNYIKQNVHKLCGELSAYKAYYLNAVPSNQVRVVIFAQGRTGSTLLEDLLCSSGYFSANGELLSKANSPFQRKLVSPMRYISGLSKLGPQNFIFHVKIIHLINDQKLDPNHFLKTLSSDGWKVVYLRRSNKINIVLSNYMACNRGRYHKFDTEEEKSQLSIDCSEFCQKIRNRMNYDRLDEEALQDIDHLKLVYEKDLENPECHQRTANKVFDYLSLGTYALQEVIENYEEFSECIHKNGYERFL